MMHRPFLLLVVSCLLLGPDNRQPTTKSLFLQDFSTFVLHSRRKTIELFSTNPIGRNDVSGNRQLPTANCQLTTKSLFPQDFSTFVSHSRLILLNHPAQIPSVEMTLAGTANCQPPTANYLLSTNNVGKFSLVKLTIDFIFFIIISNS